MKMLVTGGAGFIGRWLVKRLLEDGHDVWALDDLSNGRQENLEEFIDHPKLIEFLHGDIKDIKILDALFSNHFDICYHLAASINVQDSIDAPRTTFDNDVIGTFNVLEQCKMHRTKIVFMSTCMVYDRAHDDTGITEKHPVKPASPYAGSKIAGENMVLSYWYAYGLPAVVVRPFNTYGPFQKTGGEGGVIAIFIKKGLAGEDLGIYGTGQQTRDFLYVEDCASFVAQCGYSEAVNGEIVNAGLGRDISINDLAVMIAQDKKRIKYLEHIHPQSEIMKLLCNNDKANKLLNWQAQYSLKEGITKTTEWIKENLRLI
ncbi:nucleoside-diphosphate-sugar epimerase [Desulfosporosinus orientis DSM 765]|uniref:Nucleoside-diphosphate-sugar epimerase n=1 Tax=Desulfosporosinus orientis (strain ATCC 19365 / DSM 765 / NCIMB 8382 / VKM B-1628 / Singapore I) TaxID=768706 RepID=G7WI05_DESOD|nr:NAD-dependent epimerase/dehydratase family protein [Desulfosporosinus orientis]AET70302.1 nucleoside-diphosphate-sugar epimerase [Desulfosporosinus orientis DSM 765]